jgi:hypothetical protein
MIEYMKQRIALDVGFILDYWWFYVGVAFVTVILIVINRSKSQ